MEIEVITKEDLQQFRIQLIDDFRQLLTQQQAKVLRPWLKNADVKKLLNISSNTIQKLRINGRLPFKKIGGIHYYKYVDIERLLSVDELINE